MVDEPVDVSGATGALNELQKQTEAIKNSSKNLLDTGANYTKAAKEAFSGAAGTSMEATASAIDNLKKYYNAAGDAATKGGNEQEIANKKVSASLVWFNKQAQIAIGIFGSMDSKAKAFTNTLIAGLNKSGAFMMAKGYKTLVTELDGATGAITDIQKPLYETKRLALQIGQGFGQGFGEASLSVSAFHTAMSESMVNTRSMREEVLKVQDALKAAFSPDEMNANLKKMGSANKEFQSSLNNTNVALLVAKAKGMDAATTAKMLATAHLELGESAETAPKIFGQIAVAAKDSGLQYSAVSAAIMKSAGDLKMWGGTVGSILPVFSMFNRSLKEGQKGLAPELTAQYVGGLQKMTLAKRAFIGLRSAGSEGSSAIGAGLKQEALMEKGEEGMAEMSGNLINTLKDFTGGQMITRTEALDNPQLENQFIQQRELLKQMIGGDDATANKMIEALKKVDEGGAAVGADMAKELHSIMKSGEDSAKSTTDALKEAIINLDATVQSQGEGMIDAVKAAFERVPGFKKAKEQLRKIGRGDVGAAGAIKGFAEDMGVSKAFGSAVDTFKEAVGSFGKLKTQESDKDTFKEAIGSGAINGVSKEFGSAVDTFKEAVGSFGKLKTPESDKDTLSSIMMLGKVITRKEAIENPNLENKYVKQRTLLKNTLGGSDKSINKIMNSLGRMTTAGAPIGKLPTPDKQNIPNVAEGIAARGRLAFNDFPERARARGPFSEFQRSMANLPIDAAQEATISERKNTVGGGGAQKVEVIDKIIRVKVIPDKASVRIEVDDEEFDEKVVGALGRHQDG